MLWTIFDQQAIKPISKNRQRDFDLLAKEVEITDLQPLIGVEFYNELINNPTTSANKNLLDGGTYIVNGQSLRFAGLKYVLSYFLYARYISISDEMDTFSGVVVKSTIDSDPLSQGRIKTRVNDTRQIAFSYWSGCEMFINENSKDYPYYQVCTNKVFNKSIKYL